MRVPIVRRSDRRQAEEQEDDRLAEGGQHLREVFHRQRGVEG